ncbi:hypothetical protein ACSBR2_009213 [Camellia fascicularis]
MCSFRKREERSLTQDLGLSEVAVQKANGLWVDDKVIKVKHADFGREKRLNRPKAVIGKTSDGKGSITLKAEEIGNEWLYESVVVFLKDNYANVNLKKEFEAIGMKDILVRESGGRDVVLTFK